MSKFIKIMVAAAASLSLGAAQADTVIDLFNGTQGPVTSLTPNNTGTMQYAAEYGPDNTVAGLYRDIGVQMTATTNPVAPSTSIGVGGGSLFWSVTGATEARAIVRWDGVSGTTAGQNTDGTVTPVAGISGQFNSSGLGNGLGLSLNPIDYFQFDVNFSDLDFNFWLELYDTSGNYSKIKFEAQSHFDSTSTPIPIAAFIGQCFAPEFADPTDSNGDDVIAGVCNSVAFNPNSIGAIQFIMETKPGCTGNCGVDLAISAVKVVPEPAAIALVGLGLLGAAGIGRRRRQSV